MTRSTPSPTPMSTPVPYPTIFRARSLAQRQNALPPAHLCLADPDRLAIHARGDAPTGQALEVAGSPHGTIGQSFAAVLDDRLGPRLVAQRFAGAAHSPPLPHSRAIYGPELEHVRRHCRAPAPPSQSQSRSGLRGFRES